RLETFKNTIALDCNGRYFYDHEMEDRTPEGIEAGVTLSQGRPSAHQERETLSIEGKTYGRNTSSWEHASVNDDAHPEWGPLSMSRDPQRDCTAMKRGENLGHLNYDTILKEGHFEYLGRQWIKGHRCSEYSVTFDSTVLKSQQICLGSSDNLPY